MHGARSGPAGRIVEELRRTGVRNPVFVLDEVDRLDEAGGAAAALLEALDPAPGAAFRDRYIDVAFDLSEVLFVATATSIAAVPPMLRERIAPVELPGYTEDDKRAIATEHLLPLQLDRHGLSAEQVTGEAIAALIRGYTCEAGVWGLATALGTVCARLVRRRAEGDLAPAEVTPQTVAGMLGAPVDPHLEVLGRSGPPGVAVGLCQTAAGGGEVKALVEQTRERAAHLRLAETLSAFLTRLRAAAETLDIVERQRIVRLVVKEVLVNDDTIVTRHCIPVPSGPPPTNDGGPNNDTDNAADPRSYLLRSGSNCRPLP